MYMDLPGILNWIRAKVDEDELTKKDVFRAINREIKLKNTPKMYRTGRKSKIDKYYSKLESLMSYRTHGAIKERGYSIRWNSIVDHAYKKLCRTSFYTFKKKVLAKLDYLVNQELTDLYPENKLSSIYFKRKLTYPVDI